MSAPDRAAEQERLLRHIGSALGAGTLPVAGMQFTWDFSREPRQARAVADAVSQFAVRWEDSYPMWSGGQRLVLTAYVGAARLTVVAMADQACDPQGCPACGSGSSIYAHWAPKDEVAEAMRDAAQAADAAQAFASAPTAGAVAF